MTFREWLDINYGNGFDPDGLSDEEFWELEDRYNADKEAEYEG